VAFSTGPNDDPVVFSGKSYGMIVKPSPQPDDRPYVGWDPIFIHSGYDCTFADMPLQEKNRVSHRSLALKQVIIISSTGVLVVVVVGGE